jgi:hypothetical protein
LIIVTGCGRSGTSAVARMLHESGISVGHELIPADEGNAEGYFEERPVVQLNDEIVQTAGLAQFFSTASRELILECARPLDERMHTLAAGATPAWKDPRFSWTLEAWLPYFEEPPRVIVCLRNPAEVIASAMRYYGMAGDDGWRAIGHVWRVETERLLEIITAFRLEATCVEFDALHADIHAVAGELSAFTGNEICPVGVRSDLRHHHTDMPEEFARLYDCVRALGR